MSASFRLQVKRALLVFLLLCAGILIALLCAHCELHPLSPYAKADRILVEKGAHRLTLFHGKTPLKSYQIALCHSRAGQKQREGDQCTPEGIYMIDARNHDSVCYRALHISYPSRGERTRDARLGVAPGGDIMIHGIGNGFGWLGAFHRACNWTRGCIAVTDAEMDEIWRAVPNGTPIEIRP